MSEHDNLKQELKKHRPKKNKLTVSAEFLKEAKDYDDKLLLVKHLTELEKGRVLLILKKWLKDAVNSDTRK
jgi:hypothetical protein